MVADFQQQKWQRNVAVVSDVAGPVHQWINRGPCAGEGEARWVPVLMLWDTNRVKEKNEMGNGVHFRNRGLGTSGVVVGRFVSPVLISVYTNGTNIYAH